MKKRVKRADTIKFKNPTKGKTKFYKYGIETFITSKGDILRLRIAYDDERFILRSVGRLIPDVSFEGKGFMSHVPLKVITTDGDCRESQLLNHKARVKK